MSTARNISGYLPNLLGPVKIKGAGTETTARPAINFTGAGVTVTDDPVNDETRITIAGGGGGGGGTTPTGTGFRRVVGGVEDAAAALVDAEDATHLVAGAANTVLTSTGAAGRWQSIVNANVSGAAAIAGTKVSPDFGAQNVVTAGHLAIGASPAVAIGNAIRLSAGFGIYTRNSTNTADLAVIEEASNQLYFGHPFFNGGIFNNGAYHDFQISSASAMRVEASGVSLLGGAGSYGSGSGVVFVKNAGTNPTSNPTGGGILYASGGALRWRGPSGADTAIGPAEPHCPRCGTDVGILSAENDLFGEEMTVCRACELRTGNGIVRHVTDFFERRKAS